MPYEIKEIKDLSELDGQAEELLGKPEEKGFRIDDDKKASWALRKIRELREEKDKVNDLYKYEKEIIDSWKRQEYKKIDNSIEYFTNQLELYLREMRETNPDFRVSTPHGSVGTRRQRKYKYDDETLTEWLKKRKRDDLLTAKPKKAKIKKLFEVSGDKLVDMETGEVVEGVETWEEEDINIRIRR